MTEGNRHWVITDNLPTVAVLIVNWKSWPLLEQCIESLQRQTFTNFRVIVLDNEGEPDWINELKSRFPHVIFYSSKSNLGFAAANNFLINSAYNFEWIVTLNPDAFPVPEWLETLLNAAYINSEYSCFASRLVMANKPDNLDGDGDVYHASGLAWRKNHGSKIFRDSLSREVFSPCAAAALYRREKLLEIGGFDEDFFCYFEDVDLGFRLRLNGNRCLFVPGSVVYHIGSGTSGGKKSDFAVYHGHRNMVWSYVKNMPGYLFWYFLPLHISINLVSIIWFFLKKKGKVIVKSKIDALRGLPGMWRKRKCIQSKRVVSVMEIVKVMNKHPIPMIDRLTRRSSQY